MGASVGWDCRRSLRARRLAGVGRRHSSQGAPAQGTVSSWEGPYVGVDFGHAIGVTAITKPTRDDFLGTHGVSGGVLAGYNHILAPRWMLGIEADANWSDIDHIDKIDTGFDFASLRVTQKQSYSARSRFGYLVAPQTLLYATGGWSWAPLTYSLMSDVLTLETAKVWLNGPQVGLGIETMFASGWSARLEYLHAFYRDATINSMLLGPFNVRPNVGLARIGVIRHLGAGEDARSDAASASPAWNGPYLGGTVAAVTGTARADFPLLPGTYVNGVGAVVVTPTALAGYNWRFAPTWVAGVEAAVGPGLSASDFRVDVTEAVRGRLGYLLNPSTMVFGTVGWIGTGVRTLVENVSTPVIIPGQRINAVELGGGIDVALDDHWAARFEYQYAIADTLSNITLTLPAVAATLTQVSARPQIQYAQIGLLYMFDGR